MDNIRNEYYQASVDHRNVHKCGGFPYADGDFLTELTRAIGAKSILEIGTAIGYSAYCFADSSPEVHVDTIDMKPEHKSIAIQRWKDLKVETQIKMHVGNSHEVIPQLNKTYDIIFFDGYAPNPMEVKLYSDSLNPNGVLITTNLSWNKTAPEYLEQLTTFNLFTEQFYDTWLSSKSESRTNESSKIWGDLIVNKKRVATD